MLGQLGKRRLGSRQKCSTFSDAVSARVHRCARTSERFRRSVLTSIKSESTAAVLQILMSNPQSRVYSKNSIRVNNGRFACQKALSKLEEETRMSLMPPPHHPFPQAKKYLLAIAQRLQCDCADVYTPG